MSGPPESMSAQLPRPGDVVGGKFVLDSLLGQGGMGAVFKARHRTLGHEVAIKIMFADAGNPEAAARFENEGRAAARIKSDHVMKVHDVDRELNYLYMVLELLEGEDLAQILDRRKSLPWQEAVGYVVEALEGVAQAHAMGIVHRDLKPSNLYLARDNGPPTIKVLDFGISKASSQSPLNQSPSALTSTKAMLGSPLYMSPEQLRSSKSVDHRADIWAMGVILYELITGTLPFMGDSLGELFAAILEEEPAPLRSRAPNVPPELDAIVMKCLQRRPENRHQTARDLMAALAPFAPGAHAAPAPSPWQGGGSTAFHPPSHAGHASHLGPSGAATPSYGAMPPQPPRPGAVTGNGSAPRSMGATPPGAMAGSALPHAHTNSTWQTSSSLPTSKAPLVALIAFGAAALIGGATLVAVKMRGAPPSTDPVAAEPPPSAIIAPPPDPTPKTTPTPAETATVAAIPATASSPSASSAPSTSATVRPATHTKVTPTPKATVAATKVEPTPPPTATPKPPTKPTGGSGVTTR